MALKEIYCIPSNETRYKENIVEINSEIDTIIQQVDLLLFTNKGDILMMPEFGCNLQQYLFETNWNQMAIKEMIMDQIRTYIYLDGSILIDVNVEFYQWEYNIAMVVDLIINNNKVASYLV